MWFLTNPSSVKFVKKSKSTIGRKGNDIELMNDESISRLHAELIICSQDDLSQNCFAEVGLRFRDAGSKYGTFLNSKKLNKGEEVDVKAGDIITFGKFNNQWTVNYIEYKTSISMLDSVKKDKLSKILQPLGALQVVDNFDNTCTHLTVPQQTEISHKILQALASCKSIVTLSFWKALIESVHKNQALPEASNYLPNIRERAGVSSEAASLKVNPERKKLFFGKIFVFISNTQMEVYKEIITHARGTYKLVTGMQSKSCCASNIIVIQPKSSSNTQSSNERTIMKVNSALTASKRRMIPETEIGLALLFCSTTEWCNPEHNVDSILNLTKTTPLKISKSKILEQPTEGSSEIFKARVRPQRYPDATIVKSFETIDLDSDMEDDPKENKENVASTTSEDTMVTATDTSLSSSDHDENYLSLPKGNVTIAQIQNGNSESIQGKDSRQEIILGKGNLVEEFPAEACQIEDFHIADSVPEVIQPQLKPDKRLEIAVRTENHTSGFFNFTNVNIVNKRVAPKRKNTENELEPGPEFATIDPRSDLESKSSRTKTKTIDDSENDVIQPQQKNRKRTAENALGSDGGLFAFDTNFVKKKKQKENNVNQESKSVKESATKKTKIIINDSVEEDDDIQPQRKNRKRTAENALGSDGGLFAFDTNFVKKKKQKDSNVNLLNKVTGIVPIIESQPPPPETTEKILESQESIDNSCDSGIWLSKRVLSMKLQDSADGTKIKTEIKEEPESEHSFAQDIQDFKPAKIGNLFSVLESTTTIRNASSLVSKRKQFAKKSNFKPQDKVVTMKVLSVEETYFKLDAF